MTSVVEGAVCLVDYFKSHARRVFERLKPTLEDRRIAEAVSWIRKRGGSATLRDLYTYKVAGCKKRTHAEKLFTGLEENGWGSIETITPDHGGQPSQVFRLHSAGQRS